MGPAVMNGGLSTFLAFVLLGFSNSYVFSTFFKVGTYNWYIHRFKIHLFFKHAVYKSDIQNSQLI